jgi:hypothetical protein
MAYTCRMFLRAVVCVSLIVLSGSADAAPEDRAERRMNLWGGQASIVRPEGVRIERFKQNKNRYELTAKGTKVRVVIERGLIPSKYRGTSTERMAKEARKRLQRRGYKVEDFAVAGKTARINFAGKRTVTVQTQMGPVEARVPWRGQLRWVRQTNHRTFQSIVTVPEPERDKEAVLRLRRASSSLRVPPMRAKLWDRVTDSASGLPLLSEKVGSWMPGWKIF